MALHYRRTGEGEPLLLIHGTGSWHGVWAPVLPALEAEHDVIALDLPGFGESPPLPDGVPASIAALADAVVELLDELGLDTPHVVGWSLGGGVAFELGRRRRTASVTVLSPIGFCTDKEYAFLRRSVLNMLALGRAMAPVNRLVASNPVTRTLFAFQMAARPWRIPPPALMEASAKLADSRSLPDVTEHANRELFSAHPPIEVPTTVAWAERDRLLLPRQAQRARRLMPRARHVWLTGCGHLPFWDDPEQVGSVILEGSAARRPQPPARARA